MDGDVNSTCVFAEVDHLMCTKGSSAMHLASAQVQRSPACIMLNNSASEVHR